MPKGRKEITTAVKFDHFSRDCESEMIIFVTTSTHVREDPQTCRCRTMASWKRMASSLLVLTCLVPVIVSDAVAVSAPLAAPDMPCVGNWHAFGSLCWRPVTDAIWINGGLGVGRFCAQQGGHAMRVTFFYVCVRDKTESGLYSSGVWHKFVSKQKRAKPMTCPKKSNDVIAAMQWIVQVYG